MNTLIPIRRSSTMSATLLILFFIFFTSLPVKAADLPHILVLNSYNVGYDWSDDELKGVRSEFAKLYPRFVLYTENLDTKNFHLKNHFQAQASLLQAKYSSKKLDSIIAMDNAAFEFANRYRQKISPGTPLVFCGINDYTPNMIAGQKNLSGVAEFHDSVGTMALALKLHPATRNVLVIHDYTDTGLAMRSEVVKIASQFPNVTLKFMEEMPLEKAIEKLKQLPPDHVVLMLSYTIEKGGRTFTQHEAAKLVAGASVVPVYAVSDTQLGAGIVGGRMMGGKIQGQKAAVLVSKILSGIPADTLPVITDNLSRTMLDYLVLKRFSVNPSNIPRDAEIINKPSITFAIKKETAFIGITVGLASFICLIVLYRSLTQQKKLKNQLDLKIEDYQETLEELGTTEEMLRSQVDDYIQSQDELHATEEMLRVQLEISEENAHKFKAVFEHSPIIVALTTLPDGCFYELNNTFCQIFGYSHEEAVGKTTTELGLWVHLKERDAYLKLLMDAGFVNNFQATMRCKDGSEITMLFSGTKIDISGRPYLLSALLDISEQSRLQNQLHQSQKMDVIGQLAGGVAHDFNNMLTGIMGAAEMLKNRIGRDDKTDKLLDTILNATRRSADLTRQLLTFSRKEKLLTRPVSINAIIDTTAKLLSRTIDKKIQISTRLLAKNSVVMGDTTLLQSALLNLGINARDAMPEGGTLCYGTTDVFLDSTICNQQGFALSPGMYVEIYVSDSGHGMSRDVIEHIFEPFFTTKTTGKGTGLGLAAVYGTIQSHEGAITVHSESGVGTVFKIYLPTAVEEECHIEAADSSVICGSGTILLVDDEEILRAVGGDLLEELGYKVYFAENGEEALKLYAEKSSEISLVLLDIIMPKMGGKETLLKLLEINPTIKVVFCSGFHQEGNDQTLIALGAKGFIQKPYNRSELSMVVAMAMR